MIGIYANVDIWVLHIDIKRHEGTLTEMLILAVLWSQVEEPDAESGTQKLIWIRNESCLSPTRE